MERENIIGTPVYILKRDDLEAVIRQRIKEEINHREAERNAARVTTSQLVERWHVDPSTLWRWRKSGKLKGVKIGREITYKESDIAKILGEDISEEKPEVESRRKVEYPNDMNLADVWWGDYESFSVRCLNCLRRNDINTVGDLLSHSLIEIRYFRNFGRKSLDELFDFLDYSGLKLKED